LKGRITGQITGHCVQIGENMSSYYKWTKHPDTGKWEEAFWLDDLFGRHRYGVVFPSDRSDDPLMQITELRQVAYDPKKTKLETRNG